MFDIETLGQEIVEELSALIQEQVILADQTGMIKASTDSERLHQFHEGALNCLHQKKVLYMNEEEMLTLQGVKEGIVLPLIIEGTAIAVLGITGNPEKIQPQAQLILRVVELFIQDNLTRIKKEESMREHELYVFEWLTSTNKNKHFLERGSLLGIEIERYNRIVLIKIGKEEIGFTVDELEHFAAIQQIHSHIKFVRWGQNKLLVLLPAIEEVRLKREIESFILYVKKQKGTTLAVGVGGKTKPFELRKSFDEAERAVAVSEKKGTIVFEHELRLELVLQSLPLPVCEDFIRRTVEPLKEEPVLLGDLMTWFNENQSMQNTAKKLHIHKNTLMYRLQKIERLTGLSVTSTHDLFLLYLGLQLLEERESHFVMK